MELTKVKCIYDLKGNKGKVVVGNNYYINPCSLDFDICRQATVKVYEKEDKSIYLGRLVASAFSQRSCSIEA